MGEDEESMDEDVMPTRWRKSSYSGTSGCVEVASKLDCVYVKDSKDSGSPILSFDRAQWQTFLGEVKDSGFVGGAGCPGRD